MFMAADPSRRFTGFRDSALRSPSPGKSKHGSEARVSMCKLDISDHGEPGLDQQTYFSHLRTQGTSVWPFRVLWPQLTVATGSSLLCDGNASLPACSASRHVAGFPIFYLAALVCLCIVAFSLWYIEVDGLMFGIFSPFSFIGLITGRIVEGVGYCVGRAVVPFYRGFW